MHTYTNTRGINRNFCRLGSIFGIAKQMVKERQDIMGSDHLKGVSGKVTVDEKRIKDSWKEYTVKLMNEENEWDHRILDGVKEGPAD